jgi:hypothetical protein
MAIIIIIVTVAAAAFDIAFLDFKLSVFFKSSHLFYLFKDSVCSDGIKPFLMN